MRHKAKFVRVDKTVRDMSEFVVHFEKMVARQFKDTMTHKEVVRMLRGYADTVAILKDLHEEGD